MLIRKLKNLEEFTAQDRSSLKEILNGKKEPLKIHYSLAWASVKPEEKTLAHKLKYTEVYYILKGLGRMHINEETREVEKNDAIYIPPDSIQFIENIGTEDLEFLCIVDPAWEISAETVIR